MTEFAGKSGKDKKKASEKKWKYMGINPTTFKKYFDLVEVPSLKPTDEESVPETPPPVKVPAQRPSGKWDPDIDISDQDWTNH